MFYFTFHEHLMVINRASVLLQSQITEKGVETRKKVGKIHSIIEVQFQGLYFGFPQKCSSRSNLLRGVLFPDLSKA